MSTNIEEIKAQILEAVKMDFPAHEQSDRERKWHYRMLEEAEAKAEWSKDRSTKVGCVIANDDNQIIATGYNGFPVGINDNIDSRHERPDKYKWTEHAERNAIYQAAKLGHSINGCTLYIGWMPCADCARGIVQSGIKRVVRYTHDHIDRELLNRWEADFKITKPIFEEAGIEVIELPKLGLMTDDMWKELYELVENIKARGTDISGMTISMDKRDMNPEAVGQDMLFFLRRLWKEMGQTKMKEPLAEKSNHTEIKDETIEPRKEPIFDINNATKWWSALPLTKRDELIALYNITVKGGGISDASVFKIYHDEVHKSLIKNEKTDEQVINVDTPPSENEKTTVAQDEITSNIKDEKEITIAFTAEQLGEYSNEPKGVVANSSVVQSMFKDKTGLESYKIIKASTIVEGAESPKVRITYYK